MTSVLSEIDLRHKSETVKAAIPDETKYAGIPGKYASKKLFSMESFPIRRKISLNLSG